uniref:Uncharacterized protein n=1 Tax=Panagrolaimus superbus TaxID=310955 RepID=A0A914Y2W8_9BILA
MPGISPTNHGLNRRRPTRRFRRNNKNAVVNNSDHDYVRITWMKLIEGKAKDVKKTNSEKIKEMVLQSENVVEVFDLMIKEGRINITKAEVPKKKSNGIQNSTELLFVPKFLKALQCKGFKKQEIYIKNPQNWYEKMSKYFTSQHTVALVVPDHWDADSAVEIITQMGNIVKCLKVLLPSYRQLLCQNLLAQNITVAICDTIEEYKNAIKNMTENDFHEDNYPSELKFEA